MPLIGQAKKDWEFLSYRTKEQMKYWPKVCKRADRMFKGRRYKSEVHGYYDLWLLYSTGKLPDRDREAELRGRFREENFDSEEEFAVEEQPKKKKVSADDEDLIFPIKRRRLPGRFNEDGYLDFHDWLRCRDQSRKDLYFFASEVADDGYLIAEDRRHYKPETHQSLFDQFVSKDFDGIYTEGYTLLDFQDAMAKQNRVPRRWDSKKRRYVAIPTEVDNITNYARTALILAPRGIGKSYADAIECVQWIINCPDVRIFIVSGEFKNSVGFMLDVKKYFYLPRGSNEEPKAFHYLFPEYIMRGAMGTSNSPFITPARVHNQPRFPTVRTFSIDGTMTSQHCDVCKCDDAVTLRNSDSEETRTSIKTKLDDTASIADSWGFRDFIGTRYYSEDYYGHLLKTWENHPEDFSLKYFMTQCWIVKPEFKHVPIQDLTKDMVWLTFPRSAPWHSLRAKLLDNEIHFRCQQLNEPAGDELDMFTVHFSEAALKKHEVQPGSYDNVPGDIFVLWDWALSDKTGSDFSAGAAVKIFDKDSKKAVAVLEVIYGKWAQSELASKIVEFSMKWRPKKTVIEDSPRAGLLNYLIVELMKNKQIFIDIFWKPLIMAPNAKRNRIKALEILLSKDRLWFVHGPWTEEMFSQMIQYTGLKKNKGRKDDIPDAISFIGDYLPREFRTTQEAEFAKKAEEENEEKQLLTGQYKRIFGDGSRPLAAAPVAPPPTQQHPMSQILTKLGLRR